VHDSDLEEIISRAKSAGCRKLLVTGSSLEESRHALALAEAHPDFIFTTVGVHPCSTKEFNRPSNGSAQEHLQRLKELAMSSKHVAAFGEIGLDYDRLQHAPAHVQRDYFVAQLEVAEEVGLPLFLHSRAAAMDFENILIPRLKRLRGGVVHSFTGTAEEMERLVENGLYIGINGCSLKTEENLEVVKRVPLGSLMLESDGPWCEIRPSHASAKFLQGAAVLPGAPAMRKEKFKKNSMVKSRNEPAATAHVATVVAAVKGLSVKEVAEAAWTNTVRLFGLGETLDQ
jgi:TatD DNase family protein